MKKTLAIAAIVLGLTPSALAQISPKSPNSYGGTIANEAGLTYNKVYTVDMSAYSGDKISAQVNYGSATFAASTFSDGHQSTGNVTINGSSSLSGVTFTLGGEVFKFGSNVTLSTLDTNTAANLAAAINADSYLSGIGIVASNPNTSKVVYCTSTYDGSFYNLAMASGAYTTGANNLILSSNSMLGGVTPAYKLNSGVISVPNHGWTTGLQVAYSMADTTKLISPLTNQSTYFVTVLGGGQVGLIDTSTGAQAGNYITLLSSRAPTTGAMNYYTLTPLSLTGTPALSWQQSNDNSNWSQVYLYNNLSGGVVPSSVTVNNYTAPYATGAWDFGPFNYRYLRLNVTAPTAGGFYLNVPVYIKR